MKGIEEYYASLDGRVTVLTPLFTQWYGMKEFVIVDPDGYILIVEGSVPTAQDGTWCMVGGRPMKDVVRQVGETALATIAVGTCALDGGIQAAGGGPMPSTSQAPPCR